MVLWLLASLALPIGVGPDTLESVDLYGLRTVSGELVRTAVGLAAGDPTPDSLEPSRTRLLRVPGVAAVAMCPPCAVAREADLFCTWASGRTELRR